MHIALIARLLTVPRGLCLIYMGRIDNGLQEIREAQKVKVTEEHGVIDDAIQDRGEGYTVFSIVGRPFDT